MVERTLFLCGTHGNETFSVPVLEALTNELPRDEYEYDYIIANPRASARNVRYVDVDMNRSAPGSLKGVAYEEVRAAEIVTRAQDFDQIIDIHGTSSECGVTTLTPLPTAKNLQLAAAFAVERNVIWYSQSSLVTGPLAQHVGKPAIEIECGPKESPAIAEELYGVLERFLKNKIHGNVAQYNPRRQTYFDVVRKIPADDALKRITDFTPIEYDGETLFPYLSNTYNGIACYAMKDVSLEELHTKYADLTVD